MANNHARAAAALSVLVLGGCGGTTTTTTAAVYPYDEAYVYTTYYPADVMYSSYYWADDWSYSTIYAYFVGSLPLPAEPAVGSRDGGVVADGGARGGGPAAGVTGAIESLARGASVCPGQVTVTPKTSPPACADSTTPEERAGVTIAFNGCMVGQERIDGMLDVSAVRSTADSTCSATTMMMSQTTLTVTGLSVRQGGGAGIVIPSLTATIAANYPYKQNAQTLAAASSGEVQVYDSSGNMTADLKTQGTDMFSLPDAQSYTVDGMESVADPSTGAAAMITKGALVRSGGCCWPTGGTILVNRMGGPSPGNVAWKFGPNCGDATRDGAKVTLPACMQ